MRIAVVATTPGEQVVLRILGSDQHRSIVGLEMEPHRVVGRVALREVMPVMW